MAHLGALTQHQGAAWRLSAALARAKWHRLRTIKRMPIGFRVAPVQQA